MTKLFSHQIFWNTIETSVFAYIKHLYSDSYCCKMWKLMRVHRCIALRFADILFLRAAWFRMAIAYNTILLSENHKILHCARCSSIASNCWEGNWFFVCDIDFFYRFHTKNEDWFSKNRFMYFVGRLNLFEHDKMFYVPI